MESVMPGVGWDKLRDNNGDRLVWLAVVDDLLDISKQRFDKEAEGGIEDDQARPLAPGLPLLLDFLGFHGINRNMDSRHIIGKKLGITQSFQSSLMHPTDRHD